VKSANPRPRSSGSGDDGRGAVGVSGSGSGAVDVASGSGIGAGTSKDAAATNAADDDWWRFSTAVLIEFPTRDKANKWVHDKDTMAPLHTARQTHAKSRMLAMEGLPGTWCEERADCPAGSAYILVDNVVRDAESYKVRDGVGLGAFFFHNS
jgi:hypothetical protein